MALYDIRGLSFTYEGDEKMAIVNCDLAINEGEFVTLIGPSGCGKTTLLKHLKRDLMPNGSRKGKINFKGKDITSLEILESVTSIGMVFQDPESQVVMDTVMSEICFSMENVGLKREIILTRLAEISAYFGIEALLHKKIHELSGGQKQMINICSVLALEPEVMIFDEPTSQLDPLATKELIYMISKLNKELGITVILSTHQLEAVLEVTDSILFMKEGKLLKNDTKEAFVADIIQNHQKSRLLEYIPDDVQLPYILKTSIKAPLFTAKEIRREIKDYVSEALFLESDTVDDEEIKNVKRSKYEQVMGLNDVSFTYHYNQLAVVRDVKFDVNEQDFLAILGANGSGKSTILKLLACQLRPQKGKVKIGPRNINYRNLKAIKSKIGYVGQNVSAHFSRNSVKEELDNRCQGDYTTNSSIKELVKAFNLEGVLNHHPYDISGGQQQALAMIMALINSPSILLLDEPTKGLDPNSKLFLGELLKGLNESGVAVVMVSHDLEFVAEYCKRAVMLFNHEIVFDGQLREFFTRNNYYTTKVNQIMKTINKQCIKLSDLKD